MSTVELQSKVKEIKELQRMKEELENEIEAIQDSIKEEMRARDTDEIITGEYKIRWTDVTSNRFDSKTFKEKYNELYNQFMKMTTSKRFSIS